MINSYIFFRTDRIGDFLVSAILLKAIKRSDPNSFITVIASKKNYYYIKNIDFVDEVILFPSKFIEKSLFYLKFFLKKFYFIGILDGKKRSIYFSFITRSKLKFLFTTKSFYKTFLKSFFNKVFFSDDHISKIDEIKSLLKLINLDFLNEDLKIIDKKKVLEKKFFLPFSNKYILFHFDEKWIYDDYISEYTNIEPSNDDLISFINLLLITSNKKIIITTGMNCPKILNDVLDNKLNSNIKIFKKLDFFDLENLISKCSLLISCHGSVSHVAAALEIKQIDIIDKKKLEFYSKWTAHFRNYSPIYRKKFSELSKEITKLL